MEFEKARLLSARVIAQSRLWRERRRPSLRSGDAPLDGEAKELIMLLDIIVELAQAQGWRADEARFASL